MSIVSETLKKLEKKREPREEPAVGDQTAGKKSKIFKPLIPAVLGLVIIMAGIIYFLNENTVKNQLGSGFESKPLSDDIKQIVVQPVETTGKEEPVMKEEQVEEIKADKISEKNETDTEEEIILTPELELGGVITGQGDPYAIINGKFIRVGEEIDGTRIISIEDDSVTYSFNGKEYSVRMN